AVFEAAQKKYPDVHEALERSVAIRANFHALGISQQATQAFVEGHGLEAMALYRRGLVVLDPPNPIHEELRGQFADLLKTLEGPQGKMQTGAKTQARAEKAAPPKKKIE